MQSIDRLDSVDALGTTDAVAESSGKVVAWQYCRVIGRRQANDLEVLELWRQR